MAAPEKAAYRQARAWRRHRSPAAKQKAWQRVKRASATCLKRREAAKKASRGKAGRSCRFGDGAWWRRPWRIIVNGARHRSRSMPPSLSGIVKGETEERAHVVCIIINDWAKLAHQEYRDRKSAAGGAAAISNVKRLLPLRWAWREDAAPWHDLCCLSSDVGVATISSSWRPALCFRCNA